MGLIFLALPGAVLAPAPGGAAELAAATELARHLSWLLMAGREVIAEKQTTINDPALGAKGITGESIAADTMLRYRALAGEKIRPMDRGEIGVHMSTLIRSIQRAVDEKSDIINRIGAGFKGFVPTAFSRAAIRDFNLHTTSVQLRLTAPKHLLRSRLSPPDAWESDVIEGRLSKDAWPKGELFATRGVYGKRPAIRVLAPEYFKASCLSCHGEPMGQIDITGNPREGVKVGQLAGVISVIVY